MGVSPFAKNKQCERAVAAVIKKLMWGEEDQEKLALDGLDRYFNGEGVYSAEGELEQLQKRAEDPVSFWRHVSRSGLDCDTIFADKIAVNPSTRLNPLILPLIPSALYEPTGG